jgi:hypothetical protein
MVVIRTQISLTETQMARLRAASLREGVSIAQLIRAAVDRTLPDEDQRARRKRALAAVGCITEDAPDVARNHDRYLADTFGA